MARELQPIERLRFWYVAAAIAPSATMFATDGLAASPIFTLHGHRRIDGAFTVGGATLPAAGFPRILLSADYFATTAFTFVIGPDPLNPTSYPFDVELVYPFVKVEFTRDATVGAGTIGFSGDAFPEGA